MDAVGERHRMLSLWLLIASIAIGPIWGLATAWRFDTASIPLRSIMTTAPLVWSGVGLAFLLVLFWRAITEVAYEPEKSGRLWLATVAVASLVVASHLLAYLLIVRWVDDTPVAWLAAAGVYLVAATIATGAALFISRDVSEATGFSAYDNPATAPKAKPDPFADSAEIFFGGY